MQWMVPRSRLGSEQTDVLNAFLRREQKNHWINGFAGSGKTVVLVHAIEQIRVTEPDASIFMITYTHALKDLVQSGFSDKINDVPVTTYHQFRQTGESYDYILVDEIQDLEQEWIKDIKNKSNTVIVAGDPEQSIYDDTADAEQVVYILSPEIHYLAVIYRLTQKLRDIAQAILPGTAIEKARIDTMAEVEPVLAKAKNQEREDHWVWKTANGLAKPGDPAVIILPKHKMIYDFVSSVCRIEGKQIPDRPIKKDYSPVNSSLADSDLALRYLGGGDGSIQESDQKPLVYVMTYHSAKGLDFGAVFVPRLTDRTVIWKTEDRASRLFFVAITRSRRDLFLSYSGDAPHPLVNKIPDTLLKKIDCLVKKPEEPEDEWF